MLRPLWILALIVKSVSKQMIIMVNQAKEKVNNEMASERNPDNHQQSPLQYFLLYFKEGEVGNDRDIITHHLSYFLQSDIVDLENILDETKYVVTDAAIEQVCVVKADDTNDAIEQSDTKMSVGVNLCHLLHRRGGGGWLWWWWWVRGWESDRTIYNSPPI